MPSHWSVSPRHKSSSARYRWRLLAISCILSSLVFLQFLSEFFTRIWTVTNRGNLHILIAPLNHCTRARNTRLPFTQSTHFLLIILRTQKVLVNKLKNVLIYGRADNSDFPTATSGGYFQLRLLTYYVFISSTIMTSFTADIETFPRARSFSVPTATSDRSASC